MKLTRSRSTPAETAPLTIKGRGIAWTPDLQSLLDRRLEKVTERFPQRIRLIAASLEDVNGPRGGVDKKCRLRLMLKNRGQVSVSASSSKTEAAVARAVGRARIVLLRKLQGTRARTSDRRAQGEWPH